MRLIAVLLLRAAPAVALLGASTASTGPRLTPEISFQLDDDDVAFDADDEWRSLARKAAGLQQLDCSEDLLGATTRMLDEAEEGDSLAMAALGSMYLLGQQCAPKRNLTWGLHWLSRAEELGQADAQALMAFLHASNALHEVYGFDGLAANVTRSRELYEAAALGGSTFAAMAVGFRYGYGIGMRESCPDSAAYYERAARGAVSGLDERRRKAVDHSNDQTAEHLQPLSLVMPPREPMDAGTIEYMDYCATIGDATGKVAMGTYYHAGAYGVPCDKRAALAHFTAAAHTGDGMGHAYLGMMRLRERRFRSAIRSLRRGTRTEARAGHADGKAPSWAGLGYAHLYGAGVPQSDERGAKAIWLAARMGHLDSIYNMGVLTLQGRGVRQSTPHGFRFLSVAAEFSHPQAQLHVGHMVRLGLGVRKDCNAAQFFLKHAAEAGPLAKSLMSTALYAHDHGRPQRALMHYLLAAHAGIDVAQHNAGHLYTHAMPRLRKDETALYLRRAQQYFKFAVLQGSVDAQVQLALLLLQTKDFSTAFRLFQEAGRAGSRDALFHLGGMYWHGKGVAADAKTAFALWQSSDFSSKHAELKGVQKRVFGLARFVVEFRAFLLFAGGLMALASTGGASPVDVIRRAMGGGAQPTEGQLPSEWVDEHDDEDLFADDGDDIGGAGGADADMDADE